MKKFNDEQEKLSEETRKNKENKVVIESHTDDEGFVWEDLFLGKENKNKKVSITVVIHEE